MSDPTDEDIAALADVLVGADADRAGDLEVVAAMSDGEQSYLARVDELEDPATDGIENERCV